MKIGIIGLGMVGEAVAFGLRRIGHSVVGYDKDPNKGATNLYEILNTELVFICVPTPLGDDLKCDTSIVESVLRDLRSHLYQGLVVIKSTVPPGTTERLIKQTGMTLAFCPEFLRERARFYDFYENMEVCVAGVVFSGHAKRIQEAHGSLPKQFVMMTPTEAELTKYFINCFNAYRINFANAFYDVCKMLGADYQRIKDTVMFRTDTKSQYLDSNEAFRAFSGSCLPKDTQAFASFVSSLGMHTRIFEQIVRENDRVAGKEDDAWLRSFRKDVA